MQKYINNHPNSVSFIDTPYKIWVVDNFLSEHALDIIETNWLDRTDGRWNSAHKFVNAEKNILEDGMLALSKTDSMPYALSEIVQYFHSNEFTSYIEQLTGIDNLISDSSMRWSGMRVMIPGSHQLIHSDARKSPETGLRKELTCLVYLSKTYDAARHTGNLEIWDDDMQNCVHSIQPVYNRFLIFLNSDTSYHGVPDVNFERRSITFSILKNVNSSDRTKALFVPRPFDSNEVKEQGLNRSLVKDTFNKNNLTLWKG